MNEGEEALGTYRITQTTECAFFFSQVHVEDSPGSPG